MKKEHIQEKLQHFLHPSTPFVLGSVLLTVILLNIVLRSGREPDALTYFSYLFSTYTLVIFCLKVPAAIRRAKEFFHEMYLKTYGKYPVLDRIADSFTDYEARTSLILLCSLIYNTAYSILKIGTGVYYHSLWMGALGLYYLVLTFIRLSLVRAIRTHDEQRERKAYNITAWLMLALTLVMGAIMAQMVVRNESYHYTGYLIYAMALYAFIKIIVAAKALISRRRERDRIFSAARTVSFACAMMSMLALQTALISEFNQADNPLFPQQANGISSICITVIMLSLSLSMLIKGYRKQQL